MAIPMELEGKNLGEKHRQFNNLVKEVIASDTCKLDEFNIDEGDIQNLLKIDVACKQRNVEYILKVLTSEDMLYVSRVIKQCNWLISDVEYSVFVNPEYLNSKLFPNMNTKSVNKFIKYIQLHLKDTTRVEQFYDHEKNPAKAVNWLPNCSTEFILKNISKHVDHLKISLIKRLCEKTIMVLETLINANTNIQKSKIFEATTYLLNSKNIDKYLDIVEKLQSYGYPNLNKAATSLIMKTSPNRILDKFENYCNYIHLPTFIKFLESKNIKTFLLDQAAKAAEQKKSRGIFDLRKLKIFFESMPSDERFEFIRQIFIDKVHKQSANLLSNSEIKAMGYLYDCVKSKRWFNELQLYEYAAFDIAFSHIKELMNENPKTANTKIMFSTLVIATKQNVPDINLLLIYFRDKYHNFPQDVRYQFVKDIISQTNFYKFDQNMWNILEDIMMQDYNDSDSGLQLFLDAIFIYKILHSQSVPKLVENKIDYKALNTYRNRLNEEENEILFNNLFNHLKIKLMANNSLETEQNFQDTIYTLNKCLDLINDWNKDLRDFPLIIRTIKEIINVKKRNSWKSNLSCLYNKNKHWKKWLFEESFDLCPCESVFINAMKHDPTMFDRYKSIAEATCLKEKETVTQFLRKIKIYWVQTLTKNWINVFNNNLNNLNNQRASSRGVCILLPRVELLSILNKYAPKNPRIDYGNIDELILNLQRCFAINMYIARPSPSPETILLYAKGDYLKYSLPSLLSIYYNLSEAKSEKYISMLLNTQVSVQKHAIRFSLSKLKTGEIQIMFTEVWKTSQNNTIRSVLIKTVYDLLCKQKDLLEIEMLWNLLEMFIDNLTFHENKTVYDTLLKVSDVPSSVAAKFFVKSFTFLKSLYTSGNEYEIYKNHVKYNLFPYAREIMDSLPEAFVENMLLEFIDDDFIKESCSYTMRTNMLVLTSYLLSSKDENTQLEKYKNIFVYILNRCSTSLKENKNEDHCFRNFELLLELLSRDVQVFYFDKKMILPIQIFTTIQTELEKVLSESKNYMILTKWKLIVQFLKCLKGHLGNNWDELCLAATSQFGIDCCQLLVEHCKTYFPRIYILFANVLNSVLYAFIQNDSNALHLKLCECFLKNQNFVQGYLTALQLYPKNISLDDENHRQAEKLRLNIFNHPSLEVKMHYYNIFIDEINSK